MMKIGKTALIILNYNNFEDTLNCIESVEQFNTASIKYIIVDNGSTRQNVVTNLNDVFVSRFQDNYLLLNAEQTFSGILPYCTFLVSATNEGYARGNNLGLKLAEKDDEITHILILNNDVLFIEDIIPSLLSKMSSLENCAIISPSLYLKDMSDYDYTCARMAPTSWDLIKECLMLGLNMNSYRNRIKQKYWLFIKNPALRLKGLLEIEMPSGSCMLLKKELFKELGYFDSHTFLYFEENILYLKIYSRGLKNYLMPQLRCIHLGATSTKKSNPAFIQQCGLESRIWYLNHYCSLNLKERFVFACARRVLAFKIMIVKYLKR